MKLEKGTFAKTQVNYLGHMISNKELQADPKKVEAMKSQGVPKNVKQLRAFLRLAGNYRRFVF